MFWVLHDAGVPAKCLVYNHLGHGEFVVGWKASTSPVSTAFTNDLAPHAKDLVDIVSGKATIADR
jgi:hypothetical protein